MEKKYKKLWISFGILLLLIGPFVSSYGATTHYWKGENHELIMYSGQTLDTDVVLQNMVGGEDIILQGEITDGSDIATLIDSNLNYNVPFGSKDIEVNIKITIPEDAILGSEYNIRITFTQIAEEGGMVAMAGAISTTIPIIVREQGYVLIEESPSQTLPITTWIISAIIIVMLIITYMVLKRNKGKQKKKTK